MMKDYNMTVEQFKQFIFKKLGFVPDSLVREYAEKRADARRAARLRLKADRAPDKDPSAELAYQEGVLERMKASGCKACDVKAQEKHVARLRAELSTD